MHPHLRDIARMVRARLTPIDGRTPGQFLADGVAGFAGSWPFVLLHVAWFTLWLVLRLDINLLTLIVSLEAIFLAAFVLMSQNRAGDVAQAQADRMERMERHMDQLVSVDHEEHGRLLRDLHSHVTCAGHTTIGTSNALPLSTPQAAVKTTNPPKAAARRQNRPTLRSVPASVREVETTPNA